MKFQCNFVEAFILVKKDNKSSEELKDELRKEEVKERMVGHAFELFSKGVDDVVVVRDLGVFAPNIDVEDVQRLRSQWMAKMGVDKEIEAIEGGGEPPHVESVVELPVEPVVEPEVKPSVPEDAASPAAMIVEKDEDVEKVVEKVVQDVVEKPVASTIVEKDKAVFEGDEISHAPMPSLRDEVESDRSHAEIVRATEELRRAITSEIRAQESYEHARLEMEAAKSELGIVRAELDEFKSDIDLLKLKERVVEREPIDEPVLKSESAGGKRFEESVSRRPFEQRVGEIIDRRFEEKESEEQMAMSRSPTDQEKPAEEKPQDVKPAEVKVEEEKPVEEKPDVPVEPEVKPPVTIAESSPSVGDGFYEKLSDHLKDYKYLIVRKERGEPVIYHSRLRLIGILLGLGTGIPSGCLLLYVILLLAGML